MRSKPDDLLAMTLKALPYGIVVVDRTGRVRFSNPAADRLAGVRSGTKGKPVRDTFSLLDSDTRLPVKMPGARSFIKDATPREFARSVLVAAGGQETIVDAFVAPLPDSSGNIDGVMLLLRDMQKILLQEREDLERQKIEAIANMASSMARNFSNWLGVVSAHASTIADNLIPNTRAHEEALTILTASANAEAVTRNLLRIAKTGATHGDTTIDDVCLGRIVAGAIRLAEGAFAGENVSFRTRIPAGSVYVRCDADQLLDSILNMLRNAIDAMPDGGLVTLDAAEKSHSDSQFVVLRIRDTGVGMPRETIDQIFEPFFTTKSPEHGMGLGLTVVRRHVERWGGAIKVRSRPGHGSSFRIFIPKASVPVEQDAAETSWMGGETILLVDDREEILRETEAILREAGYKTHTARDARECVSLYKENADNIHLAIIDVVMPGRDGKTVLRDILKVNPAAAVIMISGFSRDYVRSYLERGAWGFLQKPIDRDQLLVTVRDLLDKRAKAEQATRS